MIAIDCIDRVRSAARGVASSRAGASSWIEDLTQQVLLMILEGQPVRLDRQGLNWTMHGLLDVWLESRRQRCTVLAVNEMLANPAPLPSVMAELQEVYAQATERQREAILSLLLTGGKGTGRKEQQRRGQAMYELRLRLAMGVDEANRQANQNRRRFRQGRRAPGGT